MTATTLQSGQLPSTVLHVLNSPGGGAALSTLDLIRQFHQRGIRSCAVCDDLGTPSDHEALTVAVEGRVVFTNLYWTNRKIRSALWKRPLHEAMQLWRTGFQRGSTAKVVAAAQRFGADLIHTNTIVTSEGGLAARRLGLPHVWHVRELVGPGQFCRLTREGPALGRYLAALCSKLVANSYTCGALLQDALPPGLLEVVPNGIDIAQFHPRAGSTDPRRVVVGMVGGLTARSKKHGLFVDAAALVDRGLNVEWRIYGTDPSQGGTRTADPYSNEVHARIARAGLQDRFAWPGYVTDPAKIMPQIDLLVHPADNESFGRVAVEAMAAGLPVVGVRGGGVAEIVEHGATGLLVEPDDPSALAAAIESLVRDPQRRHALGAAGRQRAETHYSLTACTEGVLRVYEMAMARPVGSPARQARGTAKATG